MINANNEVTTNADYQVYVKLGVDVQVLMKDDIDGEYIVYLLSNIDNIQNWLNIAHLVYSPSIGVFVNFEQHYEHLWFANQPSVDFVAFYNGNEKVSQFSVNSNDIIELESRLNINTPFQKIRWEFESATITSISSKKDPVIIFNEEGAYDATIKIFTSEDALICQHTKRQFILVGDVQKYRVTFHVMNEYGNNIEGAVIVITNVGQLTTMEDGTAWINLPNNNYNFTVTAGAHIPFYGSFTVQGEDMTIPVYFSAIPAKFNITFNTIINELPLSGVKISLTEGQIAAPMIKITDISGVSIFKDLSPNTYSFTASKAGYNTVNGQVLLEDADKTVIVPFIDETTTVKFVVMSNSLVPLNDALVVMGEHQALTVDGQCEFEGITIGSSHVYEISKEGYTTVNGSIGSVTENRKITEQLDELKNPAYFGVSAMQTIDDVTVGSEIILIPRIPFIPFSPKIGDKFGDGTVCYLLQDGDYGYELGKVKGIISADQDAGSFVWGNVNALVGQTQTGFGYGKFNTDRIINILQAFNSGQYAAKRANEHVSILFSDWYLPSKDELVQMYGNTDGPPPGFSGNAFYWSSSESDKTKAWAVNAGVASEKVKTEQYRVRGIRTFEMMNLDVTVNWIPTFPNDAAYYWMALPQDGGVVFEEYTKYQDKDTLAPNVWKVVTDNYNVTAIDVSGKPYILYIHKGTIHPTLGQIPQEPINTRFRL